MMLQCVLHDGDKNQQDKANRKPPISHTPCIRSQLVCICILHSKFHPGADNNILWLQQHYNKINMPKLMGKICWSLAHLLSMPPPDFMQAPRNWPSSLVQIQDLKQVHLGTLSLKSISVHMGQQNAFILDSTTRCITHSWASGQKSLGGCLWPTAHRRSLKSIAISPFSF